MIDSWQTNLNPPTSVLGFERTADAVEKIKQISWKAHSYNRHDDLIVIFEN